MKAWPSMVEELQSRWGTLPKNPKMNAAEMLGTHHQIQEELEEWVEAVEYLQKHGQCEEAEDMLADVAVDLVYYILQSVVRAGLTEKTEHRFHSVFHNNLNKVTDIENARESVKYYQKKDQESHSIRESGMKDRWLIIRTKDGKIRKPLGYVEV